MLRTDQVHITVHALSKGQHGKQLTKLWYAEIKEICANCQYVNLGVGQKGAEFRLVWDRHQHKPVVLLVHVDRQQKEHVVSVWKPDYTGLPRQVTHEDIILAKSKILNR